MELGDPGYEEEPREAEGYRVTKRDSRIDEAKEELVAFFGSRPDEVFYIKQVEVLFEKRFFYYLSQESLFQTGVQEKT